MLKFEGNLLTTCKWNVSRVHLSDRRFIFPDLLYCNLNK
jgi:hypothetical protein